MVSSRDKGARLSFGSLLGRHKQYRATGTAISKGSTGQQHPLPIRIDPMLSGRGPGDSASDVARRILVATNSVLCPRNSGAVLCPRNSGVPGIRGVPGSSLRAAN